MYYNKNRYYKILIFLFIIALVFPESALAAREKPRYYENKVRIIMKNKGTPPELRESGKGPRSFMKEVELFLGVDLSSVKPQVRELLKSINVNTLGTKNKDFSVILYESGDLEGQVDRIEDEGGNVVLSVDYTSTGDVWKIKDFANKEMTEYLTSDNWYANPVSGETYYRVLEAGYERRIPAHALGKPVHVLAMNADGTPMMGGPGGDLKQPAVTNIAYDDETGLETITYTGGTIDMTFHMPTVMSNSGALKNLLHKPDGNPLKETLDSLRNKGMISWDDVIAAIDKETRTDVTVGSRYDAAHAGYADVQIHSGGAFQAGVAFDGLFRNQLRNIPNAVVDWNEDGSRTVCTLGFSGDTHNISGGWRWGHRQVFSKKTYDANGNITDITCYNDKASGGGCPLIYGTVVKDHQGRYFLEAEGNVRGQTKRESGGADESKISESLLNGQVFYIASVKRPDWDKPSDAPDALAVQTQGPGGGSRTETTYEYYDRKNKYAYYGGTTGVFKATGEFSNQINPSDLDNLVGQKVGLYGDLAARAGEVMDGAKKEVETNRYEVQVESGRTGGEKVDTRYDHHRRFTSGISYEGQEALMFYVRDGNGVY